MFNLEGKVALITGGAGILGGAIANGLSKAGAKIAVLSRTQSKVDTKAKELNDNGGQAIALKADVLDRGQLQAANEILIRKWGRLDILINCAGGNMKGATIDPEEDIFDLSIEDFDKVTDLNLKGTVLPSIVFGQVMASQKKGCIINISSMAADRAITRVVGYSASKAAVDNFTKWLAVEMVHKHGPGIRVNAIAPGFYIAEQNKKLLLNDNGMLTTRGKTIVNEYPNGKIWETGRIDQHGFVVM